MEPKIIFEDNYLLVIDKPAGMVVNRAETTRGEKTVEDWLRQNFQFLIFNFQFLRSGIVHRLDKETSGLLVIAKTPEAFENLQRQFKERKVKKKYLALVHGKVIPKEGEIKAPVGRLPWNRERFGVIPGGREAVTRYRVLKRFDLPGGRTSARCNLVQGVTSLGMEYTLLEVSPQTGRTHQIRVHLKYLGHPIVGDSFYAGRKQAREDRKFCPRIFLHASHIEFTHPATGDSLKFDSPLPADLKTLIQRYISLYQEKK